MRYTVKYVSKANEIVNYLHTNNESQAILAEDELRNQGFETWIADAIMEILVG